MIISFSFLPSILLIGRLNGDHWENANVWWISRIVSEIMGNTGISEPADVRSPLFQRGEYHEYLDIVSRRILRELDPRFFLASITTECLNLTCPLYEAWGNFCVRIFGLQHKCELGRNDVRYTSCVIAAFYRNDVRITCANPSTYVLVYV